MKRRIWMTSENRNRLNALPSDAARRLDDAILDLADGAASGIELSDFGGFLYRTPWGDRIVYDLDASNLFIEDFTAAED